MPAQSFAHAFVHVPVHEPVQDPVQDPVQVLEQLFAHALVQVPVQDPVHVPWQLPLHPPAQSLAHDATQDPVQFPVQEPVQLVQAVLHPVEHKPEQWPEHPLDAAFSGIALSSLSTAAAWLSLLAVICAPFSGVIDVPLIASSGFVIFWICSFLMYAPAVGCVEKSYAEPL